MAARSGADLVPELAVLIEPVRIDAVAKDLAAGQTRQLRPPAHNRPSCLKHNEAEGMKKSEQATKKAENKSHSLETGTRVTGTEMKFKTDSHVRRIINDN